MTKDEAEKIARQQYFARCRLKTHDQYLSVFTSCPHDRLTRRLGRLAWRVLWRCEGCGRHVLLHANDGLIEE